MQVREFVLAFPNFRFQFTGIHSGITFNDSSFCQRSTKAITLKRKVTEDPTFENGCEISSISIILAGSFRFPTGIGERCFPRRSKPEDLPRNHFKANETSDL